MKITFFLASLLISSQVFAQQIRVQKVKGNKAVVEFSGNLVPGKTYNLGGASTSGSSPGGSRQYVVGGSFIYRSGTDTTNINTGSVSASTSSSGKDMNLLVRFGWNFDQYEIGPILVYRNVDSDYQGFHYSSIGGGGFFDYNFTPNRPGEDTIFAVTGEGTFGTYSPTTGSGGNTMGFFAGGSLKWFGLTGSTGLRADLGYDYQKITVSSSSITSAGFALRAGISTYF